MDEAEQSFWSRSFGLVLPRSVASKLLPRALAKRGISVTIDADRGRIEPGESVEITIEIANRFPVSVSVPIEGKQSWGWSVDGLEAAREESTFRSETVTELTLEGWERRSYTRRWDGTFRRPGDPPRWEPADPGRYEIEAYVPLVGQWSTDTIEVVVD